MSKSLYTSPEIEEMVASNRNLVHYVLKREFASRTHDEDLYQVGMIGLWRAACLYKPERGAFSTYAYKAIRSEILMEITRCKIPYEQHVVFDIDSFLHKHASPPIDYIDTDRMAARMTEKQAFIFMRLLEGYRQCDIARELNVAEGSVFKSVKCIRDIVSKYLELDSDSEK